jgi:hypothetical protein
LSLVRWGTPGRCGLDDIRNRGVLEGDVRHLAVEVLQISRVAILQMMSFAGLAAAEIAGAKVQVAPGDAYQGANRGHRLLDAVERERLLTAPAPIRRAKAAVRSWNLYA